MSKGGKVSKRGFNPRELWLPRHPEVKEKCRSCPFRFDNDEEFGEILRKISLANGGDGVITKDMIHRARAQVLTDVEGPPGGEFSCHLTVYHEDCGSMRPLEDRRQCKGATEFYRRCM